MKRIAALLLAAACGGSRPDTAAGPSSDSLVLERRIAPDESSEHPFGYIQVVLPVGERMYLTQWQERAILAYDSAGRFVRAIGRAGSAPGEFRSIWWVGMIADTLWVTDPLQDRITAFDSSGALLTVQTVTVQLPGWPRKGLSRGLTSDGIVVEGSWSFDELHADAIPSMIPVAISDRSGSRVRIIDRVDRGRQSFGIFTADGAGLIGEQPFADTPTIVPDPQGRGFALLRREVAEAGPTLSVAAYGAAAESLFARTLKPRREPLTDPVFDSVANGILQRAPRRDPSAFFRPDFVPVSGNAIFAADGALWVQLGRRETQEWAVLEANGECRARLSLGFPGRLEAADGWRIWVVETDSLDVPSVVRYRVVPRVPADTGC